MWSLETVREVRDLSSSREIEESVLGSLEDPEAVMFSIWTWVVSDLMLQVFERGLALNVEDIQVMQEATTQTPNPVARLRAVWAPSTRLVELVGGPADGQVLEIPRIGEVVSFDVASLPRVNSSQPPPLPDQPIATRRFDYVLGGWSQEKGRWVYRVTEPLAATARHQEAD